MMQSTLSRNPMCSCTDFATREMTAEAVGAGLAGLEIRYLGCHFRFHFRGQRRGEEDRLI